MPHFSLTDAFLFKYRTLGQLMSAFIQPVLNLLFIALLFYLLYGGYKYLTSGGDKENIAQARTMIRNAFIGLVLYLFLFVFVKFFIEAFQLDLHIIK